MRTRPPARVIVTRVSIYLASAALVLFCIFPLIWMFSTSIKDSHEIFTYPPRIIPEHPTLENFKTLFRDTNFLVYFRNTFIVTGFATLLSIIVSSIGAYSLTRFRYREQGSISLMVLFTYMFSPIMIIIPFYVLMKKFGIANTHLSLVLAYTTFSIPFALWLLRSFFQGISLDIEEAALVDGAGRLQSIVYVILPLALPGVIATAIFVFILAWNDYLFTRVLISSDELKTIPVGIQDLFQASVVDWGMIMSAGVMVTIPALVFFVLVQKWLIRGWGAGGVKG